MKRVYKYLFVFLVSMFIWPLVSNAECSYERQAELSKIASNVNFSYTYDVQANGIPKFTIYITNLTNDIYVKDSYNDIIVGVGDKEISYLENQDMNFTIYSNDSNCKNELLYTRYIMLPAFNKFSNFNECKNNPDVDICQVWIDTTALSYESFTSAFEKSVKESEEANKQIETKNRWETIKEYFMKNLSTIILLIIGLFIVVICKNIIKKR